MQYLRLLLYPFSLLYGLIVWLRNKAFDEGIYPTKEYSKPVICIGNLAVGGSGKSPMAEYIIRLLKKKKKLAVLSRGYGRKTRGFRLVSEDDTAEDTGDEPLQFKQKFKDITVAVSEKRVVGIDALEASHEVIILDDAFQHRAVAAGLNILLFDYTRLNEPFVVFPAGNFREPFSGRKRARIIVVTKTPTVLSEAERMKIMKRIKPYPKQELFFSFLDYGDLAPVYSSTALQQIPIVAFEAQTIVFLLTGIANPKPLLKKLKSSFSEVKHHDYPDHHPFSKKNIIKLVSDFNSARGKNRIIITTEKDAQRLRNAEFEELLKDLPVYFLPIMAKIHQPEEFRFNHLIEEYVS